MNRIAELRKEKHLTQIGLALKLNVSQYSISAYENGRNQLTADMLIKMSDYFNVSVDYILGISNIRNKADSFVKNKLSENEQQIIDMMRDFSEKKQSMAVGIIFALKSM